MNRTTAKSGLNETRTSSNTTKIASLDSVRGIAAFSVVVWHFMSIFYPAAIGASTISAHTRYDIFLFQSPFAALYSGSLAVSLFFILSGFVLTLRFMSDPASSLFSAAAKRYFRLMPVALASVLIAYAFMKLGLFHDIAGAQPITGSPWVGASYFAFEPSVMGAFWHGLIGTFSEIPDAATSYNPVLWTIYYEFLGSFLVFGIASLVRGNSKRWIVYVFACLAFAHTYFIGFIVGLVLADIYASNKIIMTRITELSFITKFALLILAFCIGAYPGVTDFASLGHYWNTLTLLKADLDFSRTVLQVLAGSIIILLALSWVRLRKLLEWKLFIWLGHISYSLYAVHLIILYTVTYMIFTYYNPRQGYIVASVLAIVVSTPLIFGVAYLVHRFVEIPSIAWSNKVGNWAKNSER